MPVTASLLQWYSKNARNLPWRNTSDPYLIWLSEVILQQTRVEQGLPYFLRFSEQYPKLKDLAVAKEDDVLKLWQGLGYYSRARNLLKGARQVQEEYEGRLPETYRGLLKITGIGPYTAAAISSFAFHQPHPVIDGNVNRVISRMFAVSKPIDQKEGKKEIEKGVESIFDRNQPGTFNQAIMELGSQICKPKNPLCAQCPVQDHCLAYASNTQDKFPIKSTKVKVKTEYLNYIFILASQNGIQHTLIKKRTAGFWKNLYEFPLIEGQLSKDEILKKLSDYLHFESTPKIVKSEHFQHLLSHRKLEIEFYTIHVSNSPIPSNSSIFEIELNTLSDKYPVPVPIALFISNL